MVKIKIFDYTEEKENGHLKSAHVHLAALGAENITYSENGKPVAENCFVSISHSHGKCAVCVSECPVGIDIEKIIPRSFDKIANKAFGESEKEYYNKNKSDAAFYELWTRREAYSKVCGGGLSDVLRGADTFSLEGYDFKMEKIDDFILTVCEKTK